ERQALQGIGGGAGACSPAGGPGAGGGAGRAARTGERVGQAGRLCSGSPRVTMGHARAVRNTQTPSRLQLPRLSVRRDPDRHSTTSAREYRAGEGPRRGLPRSSWWAQGWQGSGRQDDTGGAQRKRAEGGAGAVETLGALRVPRGRRQV